ncbi:hypothetical protein [Streptomyces sp. NPDC093109]|uniref:hypothetical protein n=1 Tax=Streptomyces sp. NPDC093109 TaxID=3154977 RepID=UPI0034504C52
MSITWYKTAGILSAVALAASAGIGAASDGGHLTVRGQAAVYGVLGSGEGPASVVLSPGSGEGPAFAG